MPFHRGKSNHIYCGHKLTMQAINVWLDSLAASPIGTTLRAARPARSPTPHSTSASCPITKNEYSEGCGSLLAALLPQILGRRPGAHSRPVRHIIRPTGLSAGAGHWVVCERRGLHALLWGSGTSGKEYAGAMVGVLCGLQRLMLLEGGCVLLSGSICETNEQLVDKPCVKAMKLTS
jgi:hypothetical protein